MGAPTELDCASKYRQLVQALEDLAAPVLKAKPGETIPDFYAYVKKHVRIIDLVNEPPGMSGAAAAAEIGHGRIFILPSYFQNRRADAFRAGVLVHEAYHLENPGSSHVPCSEGRECDSYSSSLVEGGGYHQRVWQ